MSDKNKVIWSEGLFLRPQHFQQQERYFERFVEGRTRGIRPHAWGFEELEIDRDLLGIGKLAVKRASGVFPDGTPFAIPEQDPSPTPLDVQPNQRDAPVSLAIPVRRPGALDCERQPSPDGVVRNAIGEIDLRDVTLDSATTALVEIGSLRCRLLAGSSSTEDFACIPLAHILECRTDRRVLLDDRFMPTVLGAKACDPLDSFLTELLGMLRQRGEALATIVSGAGRGVAEMADFLKLQAINRYEPLIQHFTQLAGLHPEDLYRWLLVLAGDLATLSGAERRRPAVFPSYQHENLRASFEPLIAALRAYLAVEGISTVVSIPVELRQPNVYLARVADASLFDSAVFYLAAKADIPIDQVRREFPQMATLAPAVRLKALVEGHHPGLQLSPLPQLPPRLPYHSGSAYFEVARNSALWADLKGSGAFGLFVREGFPNLSLEMWAIRGH